MKQINIILMNEAIRQWNGHDVTELMKKYGVLKRMHTHHTLPRW